MKCVSCAVKVAGSVRATAAPIGEAASSSVPPPVSKVRLSMAVSASRDAARPSVRAETLRVGYARLAATRPW